MAEKNSKSACVPELQVNQPVMVEILNSVPLDPQGADCPRSIEGAIIMLSDAAMRIELHRPLNTLQGLQPGDPLRITFSDLSKVYSAVTSLIEARGFLYPKLIVHRPSTFEPLQRRRYFRATAAIQVVYEIEDHLLQKNENSISYTTRALDISGGGIRFEAPVALPAGVYLRMIFMPQGNSRIEAVARVVRCIDKPEVPPFEIAAELVRINERDRDLLMRRLFQWQVENRRARQP